MSDETKAALEEAIAAHLSDEFDEPTMLTGYILQAAGQTPGDRRDSIAFCGLDGQSALLAQGLIAYARRNVDGISFYSSDA